MREDMTGAAAQPAMVEKAQHLSVNQSATHSDGSDSSVLMPPLRTITEDDSVSPDGHACVKDADSSAAAAADGKDLENSDSSSSHESSTSDSESNDNDTYREDRAWSQKQVIDPDVEKARRKAHKTAVKESNRERRKQKIKKHVKRRAINKHKHK